MAVAIESHCSPVVYRGDACEPHRVRPEHGRRGLLVLRVGHPAGRVVQLLEDALEADELAGRVVGFQAELRGSPSSPGLDGFASASSADLISVPASEPLIPALAKSPSAVAVSSMRQAELVRDGTGLRTPARSP
jgi:hypothetical protein